MNSLISNLSSCVLHPPSLGKFSQILTDLKQLCSTCWSWQLAISPLQVRREYRKKKIIKYLLENISLLAESAVDAIAFSFSARLRVCVSLHPTHLSSLWSEQSPGLVCPFLACQTFFNNKIHLLLLKAALSSYPWRSDVCSPFYHLSCTCFDCKHPDNTLVSPSQVK